jgi:Family of unknown function (DUF6159)
VLVEEGSMSRGLQVAGWALCNGETFCTQCARARGLSAVGGEPTGGSSNPVAASPPELEPFSPNGVIRERRGPRTWRLLCASLSVLRADPQLLVFPVVSMTLSLVVGALSFAFSTAGGGSSAASVSQAHGAMHGAVFLASLIATYPITFVSLYCGVALAAVLAGRLNGEPLSVSDGWTAARQRLGVIAAWTLVVCTVGALLRLIEQRVPLGAKIILAATNLSWSLASMFAVPVLAYEHLGPIDTFRRSSRIFKQRWGTQLGGIVGIGLASVFVYVPFVVLILIGVTLPGATGILLVVLGGAGLFGAIAVQVALDQIFRVFVYRSAIGLDTTAGPFAPSDLQAPFAARRRRGT